MHNSTQRSRRAAFTLSELLVAIGAVAILTVGIGRIFGSINGLVSTGIAVAEVDQIARTIEQRMREDLQALSALSEDETFVAIRMREIGHPDRPIYLSEEDRLFDIRAGISPYEQGSRAVYRRLDEVVFLAGGQGGPNAYTTAQQDGFSTQAFPKSSEARIYWGHGLKPKRSPNWPATDPADRFPQDLNALRTPPRLFEADGYFGERAGANDSSTLNPTLSTISGRNEYAADWTLARQAALLLGEDASGEPSGYTANGNFTVMAGGLVQGGAEREYAPFIRDLETYQRIWPITAPGVGDLNDPGGSSRDWPEPRLLYHGRVDIIAQSLEGVRRFLEGEPADGADGGAPLGDPALRGWAFEPGRGAIGQPPADAPAIGGFSSFNDEAQQPLWRWPRQGSNSADARYRESLRNIRSAIAGTIIRPLVEVTPPVIDYVQDDAITAANEEDPNNAVMDNHAVIAPRCSSFEIAWSDGSRAKEAIDLDRNGVPEYFVGDLIWYDFSRINPDDENRWGVERPIVEWFVANTAPQDIEWAEGRYVNPEPPVVPQTPDETGPTNPEIHPIRQQIGVVNRVTGATVGDNVEAVYNRDITGGAPSWITTPDNIEHLVIFPFRDSVRTNDDRGGAGFLDGLTQPWPKPKFIRVRMTLHDSQNRIEGGKQFEFIFPIDLTD